MPRYVFLDPPPPLNRLRITADLNLLLRQKRLFQDRIKLGPEMVPVVYQPVFEPEETAVRAIFIAPGEIHLIFLDEIAPSKLWDEWYRQVRLERLGRAADIESLEIEEEEVIYHWCYSFANVYETGLHYSGRQPWTGKIYSNTWNHMLSSGGQFPVFLRGGYRVLEPAIYSGDRDAAEEYARSL